MLVGHVVKRNVATVRPDDDVLSAARRLLDGRCGVLPVVVEDVGPAAGISEEHAADPSSGVPKEAGTMQRTITASVTGLMLLTALCAGCAKKEDAAAQAATRAEQAAARAEGAAKRAEAAASRVEIAAQRAEAAAEKAQADFTRHTRK